MESEGFGCWVEWQLLDVVEILLLITWWDDVVGATGRQLVAICHDSWADICLQDGSNKSAIFVIGHTSSIVYLSSNEVEHLVWDFLVVFNKDLELLSGHHQILVGEGVRNIPSNWSELSSVLDDGMEEAEAEQ